MFGIKKRLAALPWPTRVAVGLVMFVLGSWGSMRLAASSWVENVADADPEMNVVDYDSSFIRWNGDFGAEKVSLTHMMPDGSPGPTYLADRVVFHTPGLHWLWWNAVKGRNKRMPDSFGVTLENARDAARTEQTPGNYTNLPYDQVGCGPGSQLLTVARLRAIGLPEVRRDVSLALVRKDDATSRLTIDLLTHGAGQLTMDLDVGVPRPLRWRDTLEAFMTSELKSAQVRIADRGFVALRAAACARDAGIAPQSYHAFHMRALDARLAEGQVAFDAPVRARYAAFAENGGELVLQGNRLPKMLLKDFLALDRGRKLELGPTLSHNGGPATHFYFQPISAADAAVAGRAAAPNPAPPTVSPATDPGTPAVAAAADAAPLSDPLGIGYADLKGREGAHVEITTINGSVRRGTLVAHSSYLSTLRLDADQGGFTLSVPSDTVEGVRMIPAATAQAANPTGGAAATTPGAPRG
jgi:hypothetical protein